MRDIVILSSDFDFDKIVKHVQKGDKSKLDYQIERELKLLTDARFEPSLKGIFTMRGDVSREITRTEELLKKLREANK